MPELIRIQCINKSDRQNPDERITHVGGIQEKQRWKLAEEDAIKAIEADKINFYVHEDGRVVDVIIAKLHGKKYLKTRADGDHPDNLLSLPECPRDLLRAPVALAVGLSFPNTPVVPNKPGGFA
jgi:hypothetical protein